MTRYWIRIKDVPTHKQVLDSLNKTFKEPPRAERTPFHTWAFGHK